MIFLFILGNPKDTYHGLGFSTQITEKDHSKY